jgi:membrane protein
MVNEPTGRLRQLHQEAQTLLDDQKAATSEKLRSSRLRQFAHFWVLAVRSFIRNRCPVRASALAFSSLLALIPVLAIVLSVTTSILKAQGDKPIRDFVDKLVESVTPYVGGESSTGAGADEKTARAREEAARARKEAAEKIKEFIDRTKSGAIGATSALVLLCVAISMLVRIETTFNDIWGVARGRSWYMRVVLYWGAITLGPIVLISALGLTTAGQLHLSASTRLHFLTDLPFVRSLISGFLPATVLSATFAMVYMLLPNARVHLSAAVVGGLTAGLLWHFNNKLSVLFVSRVTSNNAVYGSLGTVPVLMVGMYLGWLILLFGAQVAYVFQNRQTYLQERLAEAISQRGREFAALRLMTQLAWCFYRGEKPPTLTRLATACGVPSHLAGQLLYTLAQSKLVLEVVAREPAYAPARPIDQITIHDVLTALRAGSGQDLATCDDPAREILHAEMARIEAAERAAAQPITLLDLVEHAETAEKAGTRA